MVIAFVCGMDSDLDHSLYPLQLIGSLCETATVSGRGLQYRLSFLLLMLLVGLVIGSTTVSLIGRSLG